MNIYNNLNKEEKYLILVRKLKEGFISFTDDLLEVFPINNNLFFQRIISHQLPDTSLYKLLKKNIDINSIEYKDEVYLKKLYFLKDYEEYLNENVSSKYFCLNELNNSNELEENIDMIWKWVKIITIIITNIDKLS